MSKIIVVPNSLEHLYELLDKDIYGIILSMEDLSSNASFYVSINDIEAILRDSHNKRLFISVNKLMHNDDLDKLEIILSKLKNLDIEKILFYDYSVLEIAKRLDIIDKLAIYQDHLNTSIMSNNFYYKEGINTSFIGSDITLKEVLEIKSNTKMKIMFLGYGYIPIYYSRRFVISNYLEYISRDSHNKMYYLKDNNDYYPIKEEKYGTTIYTKDKVNLINYIDDLEKIDYIVMNSFNIDKEVFNKDLDNFINKSIDNQENYVGFIDTETIFKVGNHE